MAEERTVVLSEPGRLDRELARLVDFSRNRVQSLIEDGGVMVDGETVTDKSYSVEPDTTVSYTVPDPRAEKAPGPEEGPLDVLHEDEGLLVLDKPSGIIVHPAPSHRAGTLVNRILHHYPEQANVGEPERAGLVHRLDRGTSGVLLVARSEEVLSALKDQFRARTVTKKYQAVVRGNFDDESVRIEVPIGRDPRNPTLRRADPEGKRAVTVVEKQGDRDGRSALECRPRTGRTHQLRVHLKYLGHPILGDVKYNGPPGERLMLHAKSIEFIHPLTDNSLRVEADTPDEVSQLWNEIRTAS